MIYFFQRNRPVQQNGNPIPPADVVSAKITLPLDEHVREKRAAHLDIEHFHPRFAIQPQLFAGNIHNNAVPFLIIRVAQDGIMGKPQPEIFRLGLIFIFDVLVNVGAEGGGHE